MEKTEYYFYNLSGTPLFIYRKGTNDTVRRRFQCTESKEYFSGLDCELSFDGVKFFNGKLSLPYAKLERITQEEFIARGTDLLDKMDEQAELVKSKLHSLLDTKYQEMGNKESFNNKVVACKNSNYHRRRMVK